MGVPPGIGGCFPGYRNEPKPLPAAASSWSPRCGFQALALYFGPLSVVQPVLVLELIFTLGLRVFLLHDGIASRTWSAALVICLGLAAFLVLASPSEGTHVPSTGQWILAVSTRGLAVLVLLALSRYGSPARRAALFGAATAVVWSVDAAFVKQTVDVLARGGMLGLLTHWPLYAMIATGVLGTVLLQGAYAVGPLARPRRPCSSSTLSRASHWASTGIDRRAGFP